MKKSITRLAALLAAFVLVGACATRPVGGTNPQAEGQTLGGYVATGAVDPDSNETATPGDDDQTLDGAPEEQAPPPER